MINHLNTNVVEGIADMTQSEFNDFCNNPDFYQIEDPHSNMSHEYEDKGEYNGLPGFP